MCSTMVKTFKNLMKISKSRKFFQKLDRSVLLGKPSKIKYYFFVALWCKHCVNITFSVTFENEFLFYSIKHPPWLACFKTRYFWLILWWFLANFDRFYHIKSKSGTKTRRKRPTAKRTPVLSCHFVMVFGEFWPFLPYQIEIRH
jgi:hypothetical protein